MEKKKHDWSITYCLLRGQPTSLVATAKGSDSGAKDAMGQLQKMADARPRRGNSQPIGLLSFENYSDEIHAFFTRASGKRVRFANIQYEGPHEEGA